MMTDSLSLLLLFAIPGVLVGAYGFWNDARLLRALRTRHEHVWRELGSPSLIMNNSIRNNLSLRAYLRERKFESLDDPEISMLARRKRLGDFLYLGCFVLALVGVLSIGLTSR